MSKKELKRYLKKNKKELSEFIELKFNQFTKYGLSWQISYKISYNSLSYKQRKMSDELSNMIWRAIKNEENEYII